MSSPSEASSLPACSMPSDKSQLPVVIVIPLPMFTPTASPSPMPEPIAIMPTPKPAVDCYLLSLNEFLPESPVSYGDDSFISLIGISQENGHVCPQKYKQASRERRILYIQGFPAKWTPMKVKDFFHEWFEALGRVVTCVTIHDLASKGTFRWIIVDSSKAALDYQEYLCRGQGIPCSKDALGEDGGFVLRGLIANVPDPWWLEHYITTWTQGPIFFDREPVRPPEGTSYLDKSFLETTRFTGSFPSPTSLDASHHTHPLRSQEQITSSPPSDSQPTTPDQPGPSSFTTQPQHIRRSSPILPELSPILRDVDTARLPDTNIPTYAALDATSFVPLAQSWAKIAEAASPNTTTIDLHPDAKRENRNPRLHPTGRIPSVEAPRAANTEPMVEQMRVVFLLNLPQNIILQDISDAVMEGPVCSIRFGTNADDGTRYAGIIFQYAENAEQFFQALLKEKANSKPGRFCFVVDVVRGEAFPADETIRAMSQPPYASRRLTLVKKGFFFIVSDRVLRRLCEKCVGGEYIQIVFLYNGGNATIVFSEVAAAIKFKRELEEKTATAKEPWNGLQITFSKDPCEVPLRLISAMGTAMQEWQ